MLGGCDASCDVVVLHDPYQCGREVLGQSHLEGDVLELPCAPSHFCGQSPHGAMVSAVLRQDPGKGVGNERSDCRVGVGGPELWDVDEIWWGVWFDWWWWAWWGPEKWW